MARDVRQRMIESTALLLAKQGLQATSFTEVLESSGAPRGSLYHHFPAGKRELVLASMGAAGERALAALDGLDGRSAVEVARSYLDRWRSLLEVSSFGIGCAITAVTVAADSHDLLDRAAEVFRAWSDRLGELLAAGGVPAGRAASLATTLIAASEGAVVLARAAESFGPFDQVAAELLQMVRAAGA